MKTYVGNGIHGTPSAAGKVHIYGISAEVQPVQRLISEIAPTDIPVLLLGESGTGKEFAAIQIHSLSRYRGLRFQKVACSSTTAESLANHSIPWVNGNSGSGGNRTGTLFL